MKKVLLAMFITVFALTGVAAAKGPGRLGTAGGPGENGQKSAPGMFWEKESVVQALSLTEGEKATLAELHNDHRNAMREMREDLREKRQAIKQIMELDNFSASDAKKHFRSAEKVRSRIQEERFELRIEQRQLLGQERFSKLRKIEKRAMEKRRRGNR